MSPSPVVELNRAVAIALRDGPAAGLELVDALLARSPDSVAASKKLLNRSRRGGLRGAFGRERRYQLRMFLSANTKIARRAGMSRTEPEFRPRSFD
jgi:predicted RNA polymerase sigma factor